MPQEKTLSHLFKLSYWQIVFLSQEGIRPSKTEITLSKPVKEAQNKSVKEQILHELICCLLYGKIILLKLCIYNHIKANNQN